MDRQSIYASHVYEPSYGENEDTRIQLQAQLETFILDFRLDNVFVYRYVRLLPWASVRRELTWPPEINCARMSSSRSTFATSTLAT